MNSFILAANVLFHPLVAFRIIKEKRDDFSFLPSFLLLVLVMVMRIITIYFTHYPLSDVNPVNTNIWQEALRMIVPLLTWTVASFAMTSILDGKTLLKEQFAATALSMIPYIVLTIPIVLSSHLLGIKEGHIYQYMQILMWGWVVIMFFVSIKTMNEYHFWKAVGVCLLIIISCFLIWILFMLFFILTEQVFGFVGDLIREIRLFYFI